MSTASSGPSPAELAEKINKLSKQIADYESKIRRSATITMVVAAIAFVLLSGYFYYGYTMIADLLKPTTLVPFAAQMIQKNIPATREAIVKQISDSAPAWAEQLSLSAREGIPELRVKMEEYVVVEVDKMLEQANKLTEEKFRHVMVDNHEVLEKGIQELSTSGKLPEDCLEALVKGLENELRTDMLEQSEHLLETLRFLSSRVRRISNGEGLDEEETCERRIAMIARRLQLMEADPKPKDGPSTETPETKSPSADPSTSATKPANAPIGSELKTANSDDSK